jgi:hypothetical protein
MGIAAGQVEIRAVPRGRSPQDDELPSVTVRAGSKGVVIRIP